MNENFERLVNSFTTQSPCGDALFQPTINPDELVMRDWVLLDRRPAKDHSKIERGDIITYKYIIC